MVKAKTKDDGSVVQGDDSVFSWILGKKDDAIHDKLRNYPNYVGYDLTLGKVRGGQPTGEKAVTVFVKRKVDKSKIQASDLIPDMIDGVITDVIETGEFYAPRPLPPKGKGVSSRALLNPIEYQKKYRPIPNGVSVGNTTITAGTVGGIATINGIRHIITNTHVACQYINQDLLNQVRDVVQPGPYDSGKVADGKGYTAKAVIMPDGQPAYNDIAAVRLDTLGDVTTKTLQANVCPKSMGILAVGDRVWKEGRTTGLTFGTVISLSASVNVSYGYVTVLHKNCILTSDMSDGGDSGSWVYKKVSAGDTITDEDRQVVAYLFAGSSSTTVLHEIQNGLSALGATPVYDDVPTPPSRDIQVDAVLVKQTSSDTFKVFGTVIDNLGAVLSGVNVLVTGVNNATVVTKSATTGGDGKYTVLDCPYNQGYSFKVDFTLTGYDPYSYNIGVH